jgi:hypothetical protein
MNQWASLGDWLLAIGTLVVNMVMARRRHAAALQRALRRLAIDGNGEA